VIELMYTGSEFMFGDDLTTRSQLRDLGLLDGSPEPHLTAKGRDWLKALEDVETEEVSEYGEMAADLVQSTSALFR
jgi:hypothetical protein